MAKAIVHSRPPVRKPKLGTINDPQTIYFGNNLPVYIFPDKSSEIVRIDLLFDAGMRRETLPLQSKFTSLLLAGGTSKMTAAEIDATFDFYGSFPLFNADREKAIVQLYLLPSFYDKMMPVLREIIYDPTFPESEFQMHRESKIQQYLISQQRVTTISQDHFYKALFGANHIYGRSLTAEDFDIIATKHLFEFHSRNYTNGLMKIAISGNLNEKLIKTTEACFGNAVVSSAHNNSDSSSGSALEKGPETVFVEKKGAVQSSIRIGKKTINIKNPDFPGLKVVDTVLGGYFGSRLMQNLREDKGYTYGIGSSLMSLMNTGIISVSTEVGTQNTKKAVAEIFREINGLSRKNISASEMKLVKTSMLGGLVRLFDGPFNTADSFLTLNNFGFGMEYFRNFEEKVRAITPNEIKQLARTYYNIEDMHQVVAGSHE